MILVLVLVQRHQVPRRLFDQRYCVGKVRFVNDPSTCDVNYSQCWFGAGKSFCVDEIYGFGVLAT